jgi:Uma2 family endonuclease
MEPRTLISVEEYLATSYSPDCDYVDGEVLERNLGEWDHGTLQGALLFYLQSRRKQWGIRVVPELRVQVKKNRFRIPDLTVVIGDPGEQILTKPPFLCIEILSPEDRMSRVQERVEDYLNMGVAYVWVVDPKTHAAWTITRSEGWREEKTGTLRTGNPAIEVPLAEVFGEEA